MCYGVIDRNEVGQGITVGQFSGVTETKCEKCPLRV